MKAFIEPLQELSGYEDMTKAAMQPGLVTISGCIDAQKPHMIYTLGRTRSRRLIVTFHEQKAKELYDDYRFFDPSVVYYPAKDVLFYQSDRSGMVRFHVIYNQIIDRFITDNATNFLQINLKIAYVYCIHQSDHLVVNQIRVIRHTVR